MCVHINTIKELINKDDLLYSIHHLSRSSPSPLHPLLLPSSVSFLYFLLLAPSPFRFRLLLTSCRVLVHARKYRLHFIFVPVKLQKITEPEIAAFEMIVSTTQHS